MSTNDQDKKPAAQGVAGASDKPLVQTTTNAGDDTGGNLTTLAGTTATTAAAVPTAVNLLGQQGMIDLGVAVRAGLGRENEASGSRDSGDVSGMDDLSEVEEDATSDEEEEEEAEDSVATSGDEVIAPTKKKTPAAVARRIAAQRANTLDQEVITMIQLINGQDSYDAKVEAIGKLNTDHYLFLPTNSGIYETTTADIGRANCVPGMSTMTWAQIYCLNKKVFESGESAIKGALLRAELVSAGWVTGNYEVTKVAPLTLKQVNSILKKDKDAIAQYAPSAKALAYLLPLAAEHVFRTTGHHYLTSMASEYAEKYNRFFSACVLQNLTNYLPAEILYHRAAHWVSLEKALAVAKHSAQKSRLPNAVVVRTQAGPAGSAIITTSEAILKALAGAGLRDAFVEHSGVDIVQLETMSKTVKEDPGKYHTIPTAYNAAPMTADEAEAFEDAKESAATLAPVLQGFLDHMPRNSALPKAKALIKHAESNPVQRKKAKIFFKETGSTKAANMAELFAMTRRGADATGNTGAIDLDDEDE